MKIHRETIASPIVKKRVNFSQNKISPKNTPRIEMKKVKAESLLTAYVCLSLNQIKQLMKATIIDWYSIEAMIDVSIL